MIENLETLRQAGFFKEYELLTDDELIALLLKKRKDDYGWLLDFDYEPGGYSFITEFLSQDDKKFLDIDLEADVCNGNYAYTYVLEQFANASNGYFNPTDIKEEWESEEGPIKVSFTSNGQQIIFRPEYMDDWLDGRIFDAINDEIRKVSDEIFYVCSGQDDEWLGQNIIHIR